MKEKLILSMISIKIFYLLFLFTFIIILNLYLSYQIKSITKIVFFELEFIEIYRKKTKSVEAF
jgi:hypothetical protein